MKTALRTIYEIKELDIPKEHSASAHVKQLTDAYNTLIKVEPGYSSVGGSARFAFNVPVGGITIGKDGLPEVNKGQYSTNFNFSRACHGYLRYTAKETTFVVDIKYPSLLRGFEGDGITEFLLSEESPWAGIFDKLVLVADKKDAPVAIINTDFSNCDVKLYTNFCIALRTVSEFDQESHFQRWRDAGFTAHEAFVFAGSFSGTYGSTLGGDGPFNYLCSYAPSGKARYVDPRLLLSNKPNTDGRTREKSDPNPCNYIWNGRSDDYIVPPINPSTGNSSGARLMSKKLTTNYNDKLTQENVSEIKDKLHKGEKIV